MKLYKIRNRETGLYSSGGGHPRWVNSGKVWSSINLIKSHIILVQKTIKIHKFAKEFLSKYLMDGELIEIEVLENNKPLCSITDIISNI